MSDSASPEVFLAAVRSRLERRQTLGGVAAWAGAVGGVALFLLMVAAVVGPSSAWRPLGALAALVALVAAGMIVRRGKQRWRSDDSVARFVGVRVPQVAGDVLSAVELGRELPELEVNPVLSAELVLALRRGVAERLSAVEPRGLVDMRRLRRRSALGLGAVGLGWALALFAWPGGLERGLSAFSTSHDDHFTTAEEPIVGDLKLELRYPAYTGLPPRVIPGSSGQVLALPGTEVNIEARALIPTREARLLLEEDGQTGKPGEAKEQRAVEVKSGNALFASFVAKTPGGYRFVLEGAGRRVREPDAHRIDLEPDRAPRVDLYAPADSLEVAGPRRVELAYSVDDDYGVGDLELVWRIGVEPEARRVVRPAVKGDRAASGKFEWDLGELELKPGVRVAYHLEAKDNDDVSGPNVGTSRTYYLSMYSPREKHEAALAEQGQLLEQAATLLADRLEVKRAEDGELVDAYNKLHAQAEALLASLAKVEQSMDADRQGSTDTKRELREMHGRLGKLTKDEEVLLSELRDRRRKSPLHGRGLDAVNVRHVPELERDVVALDDLLGRQRLEELLHVGDEMAQARDRLKQLMEQYKKTRSDSVRKEIERELRELERKLAELRDKASKLAAELPDQCLNAEAMGKNDLQDRLDKIRDLLAKGDVESAMAELEKMSSSLDKMMASMEGDLKGFRRERFSAEEKAMAELEDKVTDLQHDEQQLKSETEEVQKRTRAEAQKQMRDKIQPFVKHAREQVAQLKKHLSEVEPRALSPYDQEELGRVKQRVDDLDKMLQGGDLDEARGMARQANQGLEGMKADLKDEEARAWRGPRPGAKRAREHVTEGAEVARQLAEQIDKALPKPGELMSAEDQKKMANLAERQQAAKRRAIEMGHDLDKKTGQDGKPMQLPSQLQDGLKDAGQHMERAEGELKKRDARDAQGEESQALEKLAKMKEQLQRERRPKEQQAGGRMDKEPVKIPGADEYKAPKEFRQDLLEAMKRAAPPEYREQVKRYYEELVK